MHLRERGKMIQDGRIAPASLFHAQGRKVEEEYLDGDNPCHAFTSPYEAKALLSRNDKAYRILYDKKHNLYLVGDADLVIHREMLDNAISQGLFPGMKSWQADSYIEDELDAGRMCYAIYCPAKLTAKTYGTSIG